MSRGVNKAIIVGNLGRDPESRHTSSGSMVTTLAVATSEQWTDKQSGQKQERTEWHKITMFGKLAEIANQYLKKGSQVYIEGSIRTEKYQDKKTGEDRYSTSIIARDMQMLSGGGGGGQAPQRSQPAPAVESGGQDFSDDIPF